MSEIIGGFADQVMQAMADEPVEPARTQEEIEAYVGNVIAGMSRVGTIDILLWQSWARRTCTPAEFCAQLRAMKRIIEEAGGCSS